MPELPEVEVVCQGLRPHLVGRKIVQIRHSGMNLRTQIPIADMFRHILSRTVVDVARRAKFLIITLDNGARLLIHLGMTGRLGFFPFEVPAVRHDHLSLLLDNDLDLRLNDSRRFGAIHVFSGEEAADLDQTFFKAIGPEPLGEGFSAQYLIDKAAGKKQPVKTFLMTTTTVAGIGNIYANEILFAARIRPARSAASLSAAAWRRIVEQTRLVLQHAIDCGGSTISDFLNAERKSGYFQVHFKVYGRQGEPCPTCGRPIEKVQIGGRASYFCPKCQK